VSEGLLCFTYRMQQLDWSPWLCYCLTGT